MADQVDSTRATPAAGATRATSGPDEWPAQAADTIVRVVGSVRDKTTGPAVTAARGAVYGLLAAILATTPSGRGPSASMPSWASATPTRLAAASGSPTPWWVWP
jgi:hypothetical protein